MIYFNVHDWKKQRGKRFLTMFSLYLWFLFQWKSFLCSPSFTVSIPYRTGWYGRNFSYRSKYRISTEKLYRSGTEKSRLSDLKKIKRKKKKGFAYRSNIPKAVTFWFSFPHNAAGSTLLMVIPFRRAPFFFFPMRPYQVSFFFSSISFAFSNSFYLSFLILYAESADQG